MSEDAPRSPAGDGPPTTARPDGPPVLVTGATGYIGGRLVPRLLAGGHRVRCLVREPRKLDSRPWARDPRVEIVQVDLDDQEATARAMSGCGPGFYLIHSMLSAGADYAEHDRQLARRFSHAARQAGLTRLIYLGGLGELGAGLSEHLSSRREVEHELAATGLPVTVLRAAMIVGSGSASFEILRYLVERLPVMITPRWVKTRCQPIAVRNVLGYLAGCLDEPRTVGRTLDVGGEDVVDYLGLMRVMAEELGLRRRIVLPVPFFTPKLSSLWIHLVTPLSKDIARPLAEGLRNPVVCRDDEARRLLPQPLLTVREAIRAALDRERAGDVETAWSAAGPVPGDPDWAGGTVFVDRRETRIAAPPARVFQAVCRLGGEHGWYAADWLWRLRGAIDVLAGGPGLRRGRRDPDQIGYGEALDFWRVTAVERDRRLTLRAEMKLPGIAELEFQIEPEEVPPGIVEAPTSSRSAHTRLVQTARFRPRGLAGILYWYAVSPLHGVVFDGMMEGIRRNATSGPAVADESRALGATSDVIP